MIALDSSDAIIVLIMIYMYSIVIVIYNEWMGKYNHK